MYISHLSLTNYRNFRHLELDLPPGLIFIFGENGQGKTNLLEAAYLLTIAKSYRTNVERELIHWSNQPPPGNIATSDSPAIPHTVVSGDIEYPDGKLRLIVALQAISTEGVGGPLVKKQIRVNGVSTSAAGLLGCINGVLFTAADLDLIYGPPSKRRRFLDILISQVDRGYLRALQRYQRVVTQRNHLLRLIRDGRNAPGDLDFWDNELINEGSKVVARRAEVTKSLAPLAMQEHSRLVDGERLSIAFQPSVEAEELTDLVPRHRETEIKAGMTLVGPHRDDLALDIDGMPAATYASRGQARTIALGLRLAEALFLRQQRQEEPILLLDDIFSELD
ncbi:DNA replication/repair protein RecF, partial [Dehalococcoidia bacterium]|nr:DNA replication/repair protein RecF [Dehalococcoidia bacterium]